MFFKAIAPACAKGISFTIKVEAADGGMMAVSVTPLSETGKSGFALTPKQFVATPEEFDDEFSVVMAGFAASQQTLSQQLKAAEMIAEETGKTATAAALEIPKVSKSTPKVLSRPKPSNQPPAGLISDSDPENDEADENDNLGDEQETASSSSQTPKASAGGFDFDL